MSLNESDTRSKLIDPALYARGWTEDHIKREVTAGGIEIINGRPRKQSKGKADYTLRVQVERDTQPVAVALIEAKAEDLPPAHGLEQAKAYADSKRLNVPFVFASNGHLFVEYDRFTGLTTAPCLLADFPTPADLRTRYETGMGFGLADAAARPLLARYSGGEASRRYYQDAAIRAVFEAIAQGRKRALLSLATGAGKTRIAVNMLRRIADAGQLRRALFVCDRDELRQQGTAAFQNVFGADAAEVGRATDGSNKAKNARVHVATYQTLDIADEEGTASFLTTHYPENYFSHIVIDECHRSAWGKWSVIFTRNPDAIQIGLTATPRQLVGGPEDTPETYTDAQITADNIRHFGDPVYEYDMSQGIEDGYLAACEIVQRDIFLDAKPDHERVTGVAQEDLASKIIRDAVTGEVVAQAETRARYSAPNFESRLMLPERVRAMCHDLFDQMLLRGGPDQKTIIFCTRDSHADAVATEMNNLYSAWCRENGQERAEPYAFKCTAAGGKDYLSELRGSTRRHFIATTVDLLTTGVDVPAVRNVVFFKYVRSPITFYQMVGRGTRLDETTGKLMFRVYDYTDASRLFGSAFQTRFSLPSEPEGTESGPKPERVLQVHGFDVHVTDAGRYILTMGDDGKATPVTVEEYRERLAAKLVAVAPTLNAFRARWVQPSDRKSLFSLLPDSGRSASLIRSLDNREEFDLYDVLADLAYGMMPLSRFERAGAFTYKNQDWLAGLPDQTASTLRAIARQFAQAGIEGLENPQVLQTPEVVKAGGLTALKAIGMPPVELLNETKARMFAA